MNKKNTVNLGFFNRLLTGVKSISIVHNGISLGCDLIEYPKPLYNLEFKSGYLIDRLIVGERCIRLLRNNAIRIVFNDIDGCRCRYWSPIYEEYYNNLVDTSIKFSDYISKLNRYIRCSYKNEYVERLDESKKLLDLNDSFISLGFDVSRIKPEMKDFISDADKFVKENNKKFIKEAISSNKKLFDRLEAHPLTDHQREACVYDEDNVLVIAGAGTGKTSTMVAKAAYLVQQGLAKPEEILMLAFGKDASGELEERVSDLGYLSGSVIRTFHSLGKEIIGCYDNRATSVSVLASDGAQYVKFIDKQLEEMTREPSLAKTLKSFFLEYQYPQSNNLEFKTHSEYLEFVKNNEIRDLTGNLVKSFEELNISNYLFKNGIRFEYESEYPHSVSAPGRNVYRPDYYLPDLEVYIEHFGINEKGETRPGVDREKYNKDRDWKIRVHQENGTALIQTFSYQSNQSKKGLEKALERELRDYCIQNDIDFDGILNPVTTKNLFSRLIELGIYKNFSILLSNYLTLFKGSIYTIDNLPVTDVSKYNKTRIGLFHVIFKWVYERYGSVLNANNTMDFADMIRSAAEILNRDDFHARTESKYKFRYIMVDEFQDISPIRANLVKALRGIGNNCALFCVGDDWQAIYRFTGSDISLTTNFAENFGETHTSFLDKTFRFNNRIENVASKFVQENDKQIQKTLVTHTKSNKAEVNIVRGSRDDVLREILEKITLESISGTSVIVLSRFKESLKNVKIIKNEFPKLLIKAMSAHASKGKQADYVVLLDVVDGKYGFPSKVITDPLLESLLPTVEKYAYAEERRLFYVALTRAKKTVFLHTILGKESDFIKELSENKFDIQIEKNDLIQYVVSTAQCPECSTPGLVPIKGEYGLFYVCGLGKNYCDTTVSRCPSCEKAPLQKSSEFYFCGSPECKYKAEICPMCMVGRLVEKENSRTGEKFIGCSNYRGNERASCNYSRSIKLVNG